MNNISLHTQLGDVLISTKKIPSYEMSCWKTVVFNQDLNKEMELNAISFTAYNVSYIKEGDMLENVVDDHYRVVKCVKALLRLC